MRKEDPSPGSAGRFATTHWSIVLAAGQGTSSEAQAALGTLCETYWYPLYAFVRRLGRQAAEAQDLTQEFFVRLLEKGYVRAANRERGRFRSFLLIAFKRFLSRERDRERAKKRGGGRKMLTLDFESGERRYRLEPAHQVTAEKIYEQRWALTLLDRVFARLRDEYDHAGKRQAFDRLKDFLTGETASMTCREAAAELGMSEGAIKVAIHRLRRRYRDLVREEVAQTVAGPEDVDEELRQLFAAIHQAAS
jgi:RNA polymerase sigma-70 factor (ECF subfamily)